MSESDTPRTDVGVFTVKDTRMEIMRDDRQLVDAFLCRTIERELTAVTEQRDQWKDKYLQQNKDLGYELRDPNGTIWSECKRLQTELTAARAEIERLDVAGIHSCHNDCQRLPCVLRRERDEARRLAEKYRNLSCDSQGETDETLLPWKTINPNEL